MSSHKNEVKKRGREREIDATDRKIINFLQIDGRTSNTQMAKELGISEATVRTRLNRLINEEYIQIVAVSNPLKLGFKTVGILRINVDVTKVEHVTRELEKLKPIWFIVHATGRSDIYTEFVTRSTEDLNDLIFNRIYKIDGVVRTETSMIMKYIKRRYDWGTALDGEEKK
jgi:Lrp/AsnC family transcriptional regulator for asnA, asnC and gidA